LREGALKTARAWALKESAMSLFDFVYEGAACKHFNTYESLKYRPVGDYVAL
jgi:hypothetical protein